MVLLSRLLKLVQIHHNNGGAAGGSRLEEVESLEGLYLWEKYPRRFNESKNYFDSTSERFQLKFELVQMAHALDAMRDFVAQFGGLCSEELSKVLKGSTV